MPSIQDFIINVDNYVLPEFQREWSWKEIKILKFYDSILHGYPLPRFFTWRVGKTTPVGVSSFRDAFEKKGTIKYTPQIIKKEKLSHNTTAICDGQQRLTSFLIGFKGYNWGDIKQPKYLYLNLLHNYISKVVDKESDSLSTEDTFNSDFEGNDKINQFKFLSEKEIEKLHSEGNKNNFSNTLWIKVEDFFNYSMENHSPSDIKWRNFLIQKKLKDNLTAHCLNHVTLILERFEMNITNQVYLDFQDIGKSVSGHLENAVEFFIRINDGGVKLDPNELLFALLTRYLQDNTDINLKKDFNFIISSYSNVVTKVIKYNFLLRICLYISTENILFKADSFDENNCNKIIKDWPIIFEATKKVFELISELGLAKSINSNNSIIPVVYHYFKRLNENASYVPTIEEKNEFLKYFIKSEYSGFWGGEHGDTKLKRLWQNQVEKYLIENYNFIFDDLIKVLPKDTNFDVNETQIDTLLNSSYESVKTRPLLYLIYKGLNHSYKYEIDHIHSQSKCELSDTTLENYDYNFSQSEIEFIKKTYQLLPNLQLIRDTCNREKSNKEINEWIDSKLAKEEYDCLNNKKTKEDYLFTNFISVEAGTDVTEYMKFNNYKLFFEQRRALLRARIKAILS